MSEAAQQQAVQSWNEWDPLEEVIVGSVTGAVYPELGPILAAHGEPGWLWHYQGEYVDEELVEVAEGQLAGLVEVLETAGVRVHRPGPIPHNLSYQTPYWRCHGGWNSANPRDLFLVVGDEVIECATPLRYRHFESLAYHRLLTRCFAAGARWTAAPRPALRDELYDPAAAARIAAQRDPQRPGTLAPGAVPAYPLTEEEPVFEAADFMRCGRDLLVTRSLVTNQLGIEWVRRHLGEGFRVHEVASRCAVPWHIDTTLVPLAPGRVLVNPHWVEEVPACLREWEVLEAPPPSYGEESPMADPYFTSQWLSMNVLSLDEKHVVVDVQQRQLMERLSGWGFEPIPVPFDYVGYFGASFHCATLDLRRRGALASYCS